MQQWERHSVQEFAAMQRELLGQAAQMLAPGGTIVYSTCTFSPEENEAQIAEFWTNILRLKWCLLRDSTMDSPIGCVSLGVRIITRIALVRRLLGQRGFGLIACAVRGIMLLCCVVLVRERL